VRVVIVDDHAMVREGIQLMLAGDESIETVGEASDGAALLDLLKETNVDVVLLDLRMEGMGGLEVLEHLNRVKAPPATIVLTMHDDPSYLRRAIELGACGFVLKRSGRAVLIKALNAVASGGAYVDPHLAHALVDLATSESDMGRMDLNEDSIRLLRLLASGLGNRTIRETTGWSDSKLRTRIRTLYASLGVTRRAEAVATAMRLRLID
jgi:DNA-binding NarL/FixJ family response regulator